MVSGGGPPILRRVPSAAGSDVTVSSIDNIIQELLSHAEMEVEDSVRSIEEASLGRAANPTQPQPKGDAPSSLAEDLPPVEAEESFTPSFAQESSVWYEAQAEFDHLSDAEAANAAARAEVGLGSNDEEDEEEDVAGPSERGASDDLSDSESDFSLGSSTPGAGRRGRGYSDRDAIKSVQTRLLSVMKKEAKLHIKAEMAKTESDVLRGKVRAAEERTRRWEAKGKGLEMKFPGNKDAISCYLTELSRDPPPPLPGGYKLGEKLYYTGSNITYDHVNGDRLTHGMIANTV